MNPMYTRCPGCRAEIHFEPPADLASKPPGYRHRIKCPCCGATIGVRINTVDAVSTAEARASVQQTAPVEQTEPMQISADTTETPVVTEQAETNVRTKKSGIGRNVLMMLFSLVFVALTVVGYLVNKGTIKATSEWLLALRYFDGISPIEVLIKNMDGFKALKPLQAAFYLLTSGIFVFACVNFIVALVSAIGKKYGRAYNIVMSALLAVGAIACLFRPYLTGEYMVYNGPVEEGFDMVGFLSDARGPLLYMLIIVAVFGLLMLAFSLIFIKSLERKPKEKKEKK